jgi:hypothetical protein
MTVMDEHLAPESFGGEVVDTACAISDVPEHDDLMAVRTELADDVAEDERELEQSFWDLQA